tara:strand:- start:288 stop:515 length:228 start_codon:yes stop_codon:yes gene_type:complete
MWQRANRELKEINMTMDSDGINLRKMTRLMQECAEELEKAGYEDPAYYFNQVVDYLQEEYSMKRGFDPASKILGL